MQTAKLKHRWFQFSLRTLSVFALLISFGMSWIVVRLYRARRQRKAVEAIRRKGGHIVYDYQRLSTESRVPISLRELLGEDFFFDVWCVGINDDDLVTHLTDFPNLKELLLDSTGVTDAGLEQIKRLTNLEGLQLRLTQVTDTGLQHLKELTKLEELYVNSTQVTDAGLQHLRGLTKLRVLHVDGTQVTDAGVRDLKESLPNVLICR